MNNYTVRYNDVYIKSIFTSIYDFRKKLKIEFCTYHAIKKQHCTHVKFIDIGEIKSISWGGDFYESEIRILQKCLELIQE